MADKIDTRTRRQKNSIKTKSKPVRKDFKTIMSEINPRTREELEKKGKRKEKKTITVPSDSKNIKKFKGGGIAARGLGRAFMKGGKV